MILDFNKLIKKYKLNIKGTIHIGAHYGEEYSLYKSHNIKNLVFFEPLKDNFCILEKKLINENVLLINKALGATNKKIDMNVETANNGQSSSILDPDLHVHQYPHIVFHKKEKVDMITLDSYFKKYKDKIEKYNFINIDVQGYELEVFKGSKNTLQYIDYIISEVNRADLYKNCAKVNDLDKFLLEFNFKRVETNWLGNTWGDALYIKDK